MASWGRFAGGRIGDEILEIGEYQKRGVVPVATCFGAGACIVGAALSSSSLGPGMHVALPSSGGRRQVGLTFSVVVCSPSSAGAARLTKSHAGQAVCGRWDLG